MRDLMWGVWLRSFYWIVLPVTAAVMGLMIGVLMVLAAGHLMVGLAYLIG